MAALSEQRKGEIALKFLKVRLFKEGMKLSKETKRQIASTAKEIGIGKEEAEEFAEGIVREFVEEVFKK